MIEGIIDQTWWNMEQLLNEYFEEFVAICREFYFSPVKKENKIMAILWL